MIYERKNRFRNLHKAGEPYVSSYKKDEWIEQTMIRIKKSDHGWYTVIITRGHYPRPNSTATVTTLPHNGKDRFQFEVPHDTEINDVLDLIGTIV